MPAWSPRSAEAWRAALAACALLAAPALARPVHAQDAAVRASAMITASVLGARVVGESASALRVPPRALVRWILIAGVGTVEVRTGPGQAIRVAPASEVASRPTVVVQVADLAS